MKGGVLPDWEIRRLSKVIRQKPLIKPFIKEQLQPASYDTKLASKILVPHQRGGPIDTLKPADNRTEPADISTGYLLASWHFVLGSTVEWVNVPIDLVGRIEGKSSRARQGLQIHSAGYLDPGFRGNVTLEIVNFSPDPIILWPAVLIGQLSFEYMMGPAETPYSEKRNHYQDSRGAIESRAEA